VHEHHDEEKLLALLAENARWAMPPDRDHDDVDLKGDIGDLKHAAGLHDAG
jgi:hypothetical protein